MVCSSVMDYRNLELLPQKEWGHVNPKLLKAWTESSLARNSSNIVSLPHHSWAIVSFKMWALPQGKRKHIRLYSAPPGVIQLHRKGEEGQTMEPKTSLHHDPLGEAEEPLDCCFGPRQPEYPGPSVRVHISAPTAVCCSWSCFVAPLKLVELWLTRCACLSVSVCLCS